MDNEKGWEDASEPSSLARTALTWGVALVAAAALAKLHPAAALTAGPILMYNRLNRHISFENDTRRRIFEYVKNMPSACIADIATEVGVSHSTASYHLDKLCSFSLLTSTIDGNKVRFFINGGAFTEDERRILGALDNSETRRVLAAIAKNPWCYRAALTALLGVSSPTVNWHLERLVACGLVAETPTGRSRYLFADKGRLGAILGGLLGKLDGTGYDAAGLNALRELCADEL